MTDYEAYIHDSTQQQLATEAAQKERIAHALYTVEKRRKSNHWPQDPWRGGFGPSANDDWMIAQNMRRIEGGDSGVRAWLGRNGLTR